MKTAFYFFHLSGFYALYVFRRGQGVNQIYLTKFHMLHATNQQINSTVQQVGIDSL